MKNTKYLLLIILLVLSIISLRGITKMLYPSYSYIPVIDAPKNTTLAFIVDGELREEPPRNNNYKSRYIVCDDPNATGTVTWNGSSWDITISGITTGNTKCDVYFENAPKGWNDAPAGSLLAGIKANQSTPNPDNAVGMTAPGREVNAQSGAYMNEGLRVTEDDYGATYYYRGAQDKNFVSFAGKCWRIVRITGDGSVKLTLYNYNPTNASNPCATSVDGEALAFATFEENGSSTYRSEFNNTDDYNTYIGFMYSNNPNSNDYATVHANQNDSAILIKLKTWYDDVFTSSDKDKLADVIWCNDKRVVADLTYQPNSSNFTATGTGVGDASTYYQGLKRLYAYNSSTSSYDTANAEPSLKCGNSKTDNLISKFTASTTTDGGYGNGALNGYKIGLLTADEVAYAGAIYDTGNTTYYLYKNANEGDFVYWTMTPPLSWQYGTYAFKVSLDFGLDYSRVNSTFGIRPTIALKSDTTISGGNGTQATPFVVN